MQNTEEQRPRINTLHNIYTPPGTAPADLHQQKRARLDGAERGERADADEQTRMANEQTRTSRHGRGEHNSETLARQHSTAPHTSTAGRTAGERRANGALSQRQQTKEE